MNIKKIVITGSSGFLGKCLVSTLSQEAVTVVGVDTEQFSTSTPSNAQFFQGTILDSKLLDEVMPRVDTVVHCAAVLPRGKVDDIYAVNIEGTKRVFLKAREHGAKHFIYISSTAVYKWPQQVPVTESHPLQGQGPYGRAKVEAESFLADQRGQGVIITVLRPKSFLGVGRLGIFDVIFDWIYSGCDIPILGPGNNRYQLLDVQDLCSAILMSLRENSTLVDTEFNIGAAEFTTLKQDLQKVLDTIGNGQKVISLPSEITLNILRGLEYVNLSPIYKWVYETAAKDSYVSNDKISSALNWSPKISNFSSLLDAYQDYVRFRQSGHAEYGTSHTVRWKQGLVGLAKPFFRIRRSLSS